MWAPRTAETTYGKTGIRATSALVGSVRRQLENYVIAARHFLIAVGQASGPSFYLTADPLELVQHGQLFKPEQVVRLESASSQAASKLQNSPLPCLISEELRFQICDFSPAVGDDSVFVDLKLLPHDAGLLRVRLGGLDDLRLKELLVKDLGSGQDHVKRVKAQSLQTLRWDRPVQEVGNCLFCDKLPCSATSIQHLHCWHNLQRISQYLLSIGSCHRQHWS